MCFFIKKSFRARLILICGMLIFFTSAQAKPLVLATTNIVGDLVHNIGKDKIKVQSMMAAGVDPHSYKPTFGDMRKLAHADIIFYNGLHLEGRMDDVLDALSKLKPVYSLTKPLNKDELLWHEYVIDPHIWFDVKLWQEAAKEVTLSLSEQLPEDSAYFEDNLAKYLIELNELEEWIFIELAKIPAQQRILVTAHDAFSYFGRAYGVEVIGLQGINTISEFGLNELRTIKDIIKENSIKAVFPENSVSDRSVQALMLGAKAEGYHLEMGEELFSDTLGTQGSGAETYIKMFKHNITTFVEAMK